MLPDDIDNLCLWINGTGSPKRHALSPRRLPEFKDWLDQQTKQPVQVLFIIRTLKATFGRDSLFIAGEDREPDAPQVERAPGIVQRQFDDSASGGL